MKNYILDTNVFFNLQVNSGFGENPRQIIESFTDYARKLRISKVAAFYMPPKIVDEMLTFVSEGESHVKTFLAEITIKAPERSAITFSADVFYDLVQDIRNRSYRGLQVSEEELLSAVEDMSKRPENQSKVDYQKAIGAHITRLRERYRNATRVKFLDSVADLDVIVLAKELDGMVVSADEGVIQWARRFGVKEIFPQVLKQQLDSLLLA
jgi:RNA ligase partner protein